MATKKEKEFIESVMKILKREVKADEHNRIAAIEDLKFANGEQWDQRELTRRSTKGRPALTLNFLPKYVNQVVGDMLHNSPSVKIRPVDSKGDMNIAKIRQGIINDIEYNSNAKGIYGYASKQMVTCGYGAWRVLTRYTEDNPFLQEIYLEGIRNPFLVYMDSSAKDQNYADAKWGFLLERIPKDEFKERYPTAKVPGDEIKFGKGLADEMWYTEDCVTVTEFFRVDNEKVIMYQLEDGRVVDDHELKSIKDDWKKNFNKKLDEIDAAVKSLEQPPIGQPPIGQPPIGQPPIGQPPIGQPPIIPGQGVSEPAPKVLHKRETNKTVIKHWVMTCVDILSGGVDGKVVPGKFIPLVLLKGRELNIEGKNHVIGLVRPAKDSQKLINYWNTAAAETIALAPKAPWLGTAKMFEGYENDYASANVENFAFLKANVDPDMPGMLPQRQSPGQPPIAIFEQIRRGEENLKSVIGMFNADVGAPGSEQTGAAITARQRPGDIGTFEFSENLARAVLYTGRIINEMIPMVYDSERDIRIRDIDDSETFIPINTTVGSAMKVVKENPERYPGINLAKLRSLFSKDGKNAKYNDVTVGKYDVIVTTGPSYATQRQEAQAHLLQLIQAMPQQMGVALDLLVQNMDFKEADELAKRLRKPLIMQGLVKPRPDEQIQPPPPNPQMMLAQTKLQIEQGKQQLQAMKSEQERLKIEHEKIKIQLEIAKLQAMAQPQGDDKSQNNVEILERISRLQLDADRLALEQRKFEHQMHNDEQNHDHNAHKIDMDSMLKMLQIEAMGRARSNASRG